MSIIQKATEVAAKLMPDKQVDPLIDGPGEAGSAVGQAVSRLDGPIKVAGEARFAAEVAIEGLTYAALVCSTIPRGRVVSIDADEARSAPGVILVMTHENAPEMASPPQMFTDPHGATTSDLPIMQNAEIHWNGEPVALVLGETQEQADYGASLIGVEYEQNDADLDFEAMFSGAEAPDAILGEPASVSMGHAEDALGEAAHVVDEVYTTPRLYHAAIEPHAATIVWNGAGDLLVHDSLQTIADAKSAYAKVFGLKEKNVRVLSPFVGGGFGSKYVWSHQLLAIAAAKLAERPVRIVLSREEVFRVTGGRTLTKQRVALGAKADGTLASLIHTGTTAMTRYNEFPEQFTFSTRHMYAAAALFIAQEVVRLDMVANTSMRAPGEAVGTFALESALDELAIAMAVDPIELRRRMEPERDPTKDTPFSSRNLLQAYEDGATRFGWKGRDSSSESRRDGEWLIGQGVASAYYPYYRMPGCAARIELTVDGRAVVQSSVHEMGMGTATVQAQHAADRLGLPIDLVTFQYGDSDLPAGTIAGGSSQSATVIGAVMAAHEALLKKLLKLVGSGSALKGAKHDEVMSRNGGLCRIDAPDQCESYVSLLEGAGEKSIAAEASGSMPLEIMKYSMHSYGAQFCEARVNSITGEVRISRWLGSFDTGRILNPKTAASQFRGAIVMGLGLALTEEALFDKRTGRFMNPSLAEYHVPVHLDVPEIDVIWTDIPDPLSPMGVHGIGEIGVTGVGAAVANAVHDACGVRIRNLPITLDKVLAGLSAQT
ncbi:xanthine dehydrogenase family protein molybdopterin-binding subunit [Novosphingopyxis sp.]|uniref:xanthine dehydrogenase family protein molybdopterin-binding subunit n=1 Tax=Novosphingopyxis sp. TaxID=2709690 RepID=UPI003B5B082A